MSEPHANPHRTDPAEQGEGVPTLAARTDDGRVLVITPTAMAVEGPPPETSPPEHEQSTGEVTGPGEGPVGDEERDRSIADQVEQPAKVMRIGTMTRQLLEEVRSAPLDDPSRKRLRDIHAAAIKELSAGLAPELVQELNRMAAPFTTDETPSDAELRIAQAQLVGWLEGLFQGIQTALVAQQMAARAQLEQMRRALPPGTAPGVGDSAESPRPNGMYL